MRSGVGIAVVTSSNAVADGVPVAAVLQESKERGRRSFAGRAEARRVALPPVTSVLLLRQATGALLLETGGDQ